MILESLQIQLNTSSPTNFSGANKRFDQKSKKNTNLQVK